jgi:hypothetical protein
MRRHLLAALGLALPAAVVIATGAEAAVGSTVHPSSQPLYDEVDWRRRHRRWRWRHHHRYYYGEAAPAPEPAQAAAPTPGQS